MKKINVLHILALLSLGCIGNTFTAAEVERKEEAEDLPPSYEEALEIQLFDLITGHTESSRDFLKKLNALLHKGLNINTTKLGEYKETPLEVAINNIYVSLMKINNLLNRNTRAQSEIENSENIRRMNAMIQEMQKIINKLQAQK